MELRQYFSVLWKWVWLIVLSTMLAAGSSYVASRAATPLYQTKTTLMVGRATQNPDPNSADLYTGQQLAYTYSQLARREPVLQGAINSLGLNMSWEALANQVNTSIVLNTQLLEIYVIDIDPYRAKVLADAIAQNLILQGPKGAAGVSSDDLSFIQAQLDELKAKISNGQSDVELLWQELDAANSAALIQDLQNQINILDSKISGWQSTYSQLLNSLQGGNVNTLTVVEEATIPSTPISPNIKMNVLVAAAIGFALAVGGVFLMEYLDDTVKTPEDIQRVTKLPIIGTIAHIKGKSYEEKLVASHNPLEPVVESFRALRTNIQYSSVDKPIHSLLITSPGPGEGKSVCLANLGVVMAQAGIKVVIVDADFRKPIQDQIFGLSNETGLSDIILENNTNISNLIKNTEIQNLRILTSGSLPSNPDILMETERIKYVLRRLEMEADIVILDSPPVLVVADAAILGTQVDSVILLINSGHTKPYHLARAIDEMRRVHVNIIGIILNRSTLYQKNHYYYYRKNGQENGEKKLPRIEELDRFPWSTDRQDIAPFPSNVQSPDLLTRLKYSPTKPLDYQAASRWLSKSMRSKKVDKNNLEN